MRLKDLAKGLGFNEGLVTGAVLAALCFVGSWVWAERAEVSLVDAMTALGTVGATLAAVGVGCIALYISRNEERLRQQTRRQVAAIAVGKAIPILDFACAKLNSYIEDELVSYLDSDMSDRYACLGNRQKHEAHRSLIYRTLQSLEGIKIDDLFAIPSGFAARTALLSARMRRALDTVDDMHRRFHRPVDRSARFVDNSHGLKDRLNEHWVMLYAAGEELRDLVTVGHAYFKEETGREIL